MNETVSAMPGEQPNTQRLTLAPIDSYAESKLSSPGAPLTKRLLGESDVLSAGIHRYHHDYEAKVKAYQTALMRKTGLIRPPTEGVVDHTFFRRQYQALLTHIDRNKLVPAWQEGQERSITLAAIIGEENMALCRLAIEEEAQSLSYRTSVFEHAVTGYTGEAWEKQPAIIIAGPSGGGKSHASRSIIKDITGSERVDTGNIHNFLVNVDGEYARSVSHVFNDTVALAETFGFEHGVSDLHDKTREYTQGPKRILRAAAFQATETGKAGVIMPETFTDYFASSYIRHAVKRFVGLCHKPHVNPVFVEVEANQEAVRHDAEKRAQTQSKAYNTKGFSLSVFCSTYVKKLLHKAVAHTVSFVTYTNDRILVKPQGETWVEAKYGAPGAIPVSRRIFESWLAAPQEVRLDFKDYEKGKTTTALLHFEHHLRARQQLKHYVHALSKQTKTDEQQVKIAYFNKMLQDTRQHPSDNAQIIIDELIEDAKNLKVNGIPIIPLIFFSQQERKLVYTLLQALQSDTTKPMETDFGIVFKKQMDQRVYSNPKDKWSSGISRPRDVSNNFVIVFNPDIPDASRSEPKRTSPVAASADTAVAIDSDPTPSTRTAQPSQLSAFESQFYLNSPDTDSHSIRYAVKQLENLTHPEHAAMSVQDKLRQYARLMPKLSDFLLRYQQTDAETQNKYKKFYDRASLVNTALLETMADISPSLAKIVADVDTLKQGIASWDNDILGVNKQEEEDPHGYMVKANYPAYIRAVSAQAKTRLGLAEAQAQTLIDRSKRLDDIGIPTLLEAVRVCRDAVHAQLSLPSVTPQIAQTSKTTISHLDAALQRLPLSTSHRQVLDRVNGFFGKKTIVINALDDKKEIARYEKSHTHLKSLQAILLAVQLELADYRPATLKHIKENPEKAAATLAELKHYQQQLQDLHLLDDHFKLNTAMPGFNALMHNDDGKLGKNVSVVTELNNLVDTLTAIPKRTLLAIPPGLTTPAQQQPLSEFTREFCKSHPRLSKLATELERSIRNLAQLVGIQPKPIEKHTVALPPITPKSSEKGTHSETNPNLTAALAAREESKKSAENDHDDKDSKSQKPPGLHR